MQVRVCVRWGATGNVVKKGLHRCKIGSDVSVLVEVSRVRDVRDSVGSTQVKPNEGGYREVIVL